MEFLDAEQFDDVGMGRDVEEAGSDHLAPGREIGAVVMFAGLLGNIPVFQLVVKAPRAEVVHAAQPVVEVVGGGGGPHKGFFRIQPVEFHAEEHLTAGRIGGGPGLESRHFAYIVIQMGFELVAVFVAVGIAQRARGMFAEAVEPQTGGFGGGVHFRRGVATVGIQGMRVQIPQNHGLSFGAGGASCLCGVHVAGRRAVWRRREAVAPLRGGKARPGGCAPGLACFGTMLPRRRRGGARFPDRPCVPRPWPE